MSDKTMETGRKLAKASLKSILNKLVTCWEEEKWCLLESDRKRIKQLKENLFKLSNELGKRVDKNEKLLPRDIVEEARAIANWFIKLSREIK